MQESSYDDQPKQHEGGGRHGMKLNKNKITLEHDGSLYRDCFSPNIVFDDEEFRRMYRMRMHFAGASLGAICNIDFYIVHNRVITQLCGGVGIVAL